MCVSYKDAAWEACDDFERLCAEHMLLYVRSVERKRAEMRATVGEAEKAGVDRANSGLVQLRREVLELRRRKDQLNQLSRTEDPIQFFQVMKSLWKCGIQFSADTLKKCHLFVLRRLSGPCAPFQYSQTRMKDLTC